MTETETMLAIAQAAADATRTSAWLPTSARGSAASRPTVADPATGETVTERAAAVLCRAVHPHRWTHTPQIVCAICQRNIEALAAAGLLTPAPADQRALTYGRQILALLDGADERRDQPAQTDDPAQLRARLTADDTLRQATHIEPDDRLIECPECRSVFEAEDHTVVDPDMALRQAVEMEPAEAMALTVAWAQVERGDEPMPNVAAVCVMVLERIRRAALETRVLDTHPGGDT